ncbi:hypothetical protein [Pseudomonas sp. NFACC45]|uniref:hypothetical protein n=1 Tax=Pseudomonas sp. NFACC45 TaxID=1566201 RepID=UPI0015A6152C
MGQLYWLTGSLFIDRSNPRASIQSMRKVAKNVVANNTSLWISRCAGRSVARPPAATTAARGSADVAVPAGTPVENRPCPTR